MGCDAGLGSEPGASLVRKVSVGGDASLSLVPVALIAVEVGEGVRRRDRESLRLPVLDRVGAPLRGDGRLRPFAVAGEQLRVRRGPERAPGEALDAGLLEDRAGPA